MSTSDSPSEPQDQSLLSNPSTWTTGSDPPTSKQTSFLRTLAASHSRTDIDTSSVSKSEASQLIDELKNQPPSSNPNPPSKNNGDEGGGGSIQDPTTWSTGSDPATEKQRGYIAVMAARAGEDVDTKGEMGKSEASRRIEELKGKTGM